MRFVEADFDGVRTTMPNPWSLVKHAGSISRWQSCHTKLPAIARLFQQPKCLRYLFTRRRRHQFAWCEHIVSHTE